MSTEDDKWKTRLQYSSVNNFPTGHNIKNNTVDRGKWSIECFTFSFFMQFTCLENNQFLPGKNRNTGNSNFNYLFGAAVQPEFHEILIFFSASNCFFSFVFLTCFDVLISKMNFFKKKNYFDTFPSKKHCEKLRLSLSQTPLRKKALDGKLLVPSHFVNPPTIHPSYLRQLLLASGQDSLMCAVQKKKKTSLVIKLEVEKGIAVIKFHNR
jgi:hypothetical protein